MTQSDISQRDFSIGMVRGVGPQEIDARAVIDHIDGLYEADGGAYARGGSEVFSNQIGRPDLAPNTLLTNLITNSTFEIDTTGWNLSAIGYSSTTFAISTDWASGGTKSLHVAGTKSNDADVKVLGAYTDELTLTTPGTLPYFSFSADTNLVDAPGATGDYSFELSINWFDVSHAFISATHNSRNIALGTAAPLFLGNIPAGAVYAVALVQAYSTTALDVIDFYVDNVRFAQFDEWTPSTENITFSDDFVGAAAPLDGRISDTGQAWDDLNDASAIDGSGNLIRERDTHHHVQPGGSYGMVTHASPVLSMEMEFSFTGTPDTLDHSNVCVMIYAAEDTRQGTYPEFSVFENFIHLTFGPWVFGANVYTDSDEEASWQEEYPEGMLAFDTTYSVRAERYGRDVVIVGPDEINGHPALRVLSHDKIETYAGPYTVFQCYDANSTTFDPQIESAAVATAHDGTWIWDGYFGAGRRTLFATDEDFYVLDDDDETLLNLGSDGLPLPKPSALIESQLFIGGGYIYGGSRSVADYTTGTITLTAATYDANGVITNEVAAKTVTGSGTTWGALIDEGMMLQRADERVYVVDSVDSTTQLTLRDPYEGTGGAGITYTLTPFYKMRTADPYEIGEFYAVAANRLLTGADNIFKFSEIQRPHKWTLTAGTPTTEIPNTHEFAEGVKLHGLGVIGNTVLVLTTGGIWTLNGIAFDIVDSQGNANHKLEVLSRELVAFGQTATWQQALIVPCTSGIFMLDGVSAPRRISRPIDELYQDYVDRPYRMGQPAVYNDHYIQPIIAGTGLVKDTLIARLDRPIQVAGQSAFPWSRQSAARLACPAYAVRHEQTTGDRHLLGVDRTLAQIVDCSGFWLPATAPTTDANGDAPQWVLVTRDYETGNLTDNTVRTMRPRYELEGDAELQVEYGFGVISESGPRLGEVNFGEFEFAGVDEGLYYALGDLGESDGLHPEHLRVNVHTRWIRYRLSCTEPRRRLRLRSMETFVRPSQAMRR